MNDIFDNEDKGFEGDNSVNNGYSEKLEVVKEAEIVQEIGDNVQQNQYFESAKPNQINSQNFQEENVASPYAKRKSKK